MEISYMTMEDFTNIEPLYTSEFDDLWKPNTLKTELESNSYSCIVAKTDNKIVGFASLWISVDDAHITNIAVRKSFRHTGIGSKLLEKLIFIAKKSNKTSITLEVNINNEYAQKLYLKYGFSNLGIRKKYYNNTDDAYIMTLNF